MAKCGITVCQTPHVFSDSPVINENYYPIDALNKAQFTFFNGALDPFKGSCSTMVLCARHFCSFIQGGITQLAPLLKMKRFAIAEIDEGALEEELRRDRQRRLVAYINRHAEPTEIRLDEQNEEKEARPSNHQPSASPTQSQHDEETGETTSDSSSQNIIVAPQTRKSQVRCTCSTTCSRRTKKKPGCVCKDAGVRCTAQCLCGTKKRGKIAKQCKNGKVSSIGPNK